MLLWFLLCNAYIVRVHGSEKSLELLDSLLMSMPSDDEGTSHMSDGDGTNDRSSSRYQAWPVYQQPESNLRRNQFFSPLGSTELREAVCPQVYCFTFRNRTTELVQLECKSSLMEQNTHAVIDLINCRYWKSPTTQTGIPGAGLDLNGPSTNDGRGFDLKIILSPSPERKVNRENREAITSTERRLQIDEMTPGLLGRLVSTLRTALHMQKSPVHLTLSFIYINRLRRIDVGDLSTRSRVTRLSLWNPFEWDEDSLIPQSVSPTDPDYVTSPIRTSFPPYFRLTVFCDHANRNPSFRRLWLPWKSWQVRFNHCHDLYVCRTWLSKYPICDLSPDTDSAKSHTYMPSSFLMPKIPKLDMTTLSTLLRASSSVNRARADNQILYENQCQIEPSPLDPLDDLKLNYEQSCWQPGAYQPHRIGDTLEFILPSSDTSTSSDNRPPSTGIHLHGGSVITVNSTTSSTLSTTIPTTTTTNAPIASNVNLRLKPLEVLSPVDQPSGENTDLSNNPHENTTTESVTTQPSKIILSTAGPSGLKEWNFDSIVHEHDETKGELSLAHMTTAVIILSILVVVLLLGVIFLILWVRTRQNESRRKDLQSNGFLPYSDSSMSKRSHNLHDYPQYECEDGKQMKYTLIESTPNEKTSCKTLAPNGSSNSVIQYPKTHQLHDANSGYKRSQTDLFDNHENSMQPIDSTKRSNNTRPPICDYDVSGGVGVIDPNADVSNSGFQQSPKQKSSSRRVRRASHPSESPSLQRKPTQSTGVYETEADYVRAGPGQNATTTHPWLTSSQYSLHSRSRSKLDQNGPSRLSRIPNSTQSSEPHSSLSEAIRLRSDKSPLNKIRKLRKCSPIRHPKKQHTLVFEDGELDEDKWPIGLRSSLKKL